MNSRNWSRFNRRSSLVAVAVGLTAAGLGVVPSAALAATQTYIVELHDPPLASYTGGKPGLAPTSPKITERALNPDSVAARRYRSFLDAQQQSALQVLGGQHPTIHYSYRTAFAGFAARLNPAQVTKLRKAPQIARVTADKLLHLMRVSPRDAQTLLGGKNGDGASYLDLPLGLWDRLGGVDKAGEGVIIGDLDTGITPDHPSFADHPGGGYLGADYKAPEVWDGVCQGGDGFATTACNKKLIGARYYLDGFGKERLAPGSFISPYDDDGHGSHTAATAAGNFGVSPKIDGNNLNVTAISGIAPRAYIAAYKVCWNGVNGADGCATSDTLAALDDAIADGVDVINYSIGGDESEVIGPMEVGFLAASDAGVFVANSAGNAGPGEGTVGSPTSVPWVTSVAASTLARTFQARATVRTPGQLEFTVEGASVTNALSEHPLIDAENAGKESVKASDAELCLPNTLDRAKVKGTVVVCKRGKNARVDKGHNVQLAGGVGMILYNASDDEETLTDNHFIPAVHVLHSDGLKIKKSIKDGTTVVLTQGKEAALDRGAIMADFSSRGPQSASPDIAKPDITAPGVNILAAAAPRIASAVGKPGELFQSISGTSMSSPHVAGAAALLRQLHPLFTPAEIKSSLMTTANPSVLKEDGKTPATAFDTGSGEIDPNKAADPGLVLDVSTRDYLGYIKHMVPTLKKIKVEPIAPTDLNLASISNSHVLSELTTKRSFTSVEDKLSRWEVSVEGLKGFESSVSPNRFTIRPGHKQSVEFTFSVVRAPMDEYRFGTVVLKSGSKTVRIPVSLKPSAVEAPKHVKVVANKTAGQHKFEVKTGFNGKLSTVSYGPVAPVVKTGLKIDTTKGVPVLKHPDAGTQLHYVTIAPDTKLFVARLANVDEGDLTTDLDLYLFKVKSEDDLSDAQLVALSVKDTWDEEIMQLEPKPGKYVLAVVGVATNIGQSVYDLNTWTVSGDKPIQASDTRSVNPELAIAGSPFDAKHSGSIFVPLAWKGISKVGTYFGVVSYHDDSTAKNDNKKALSVVELTRKVRRAPRPQPVVGTAVPQPPAGSATTPVPPPPVRKGHPAPPAPPVPPRPASALESELAPLMPLAQLSGVPGKLMQQPKHQAIGTQSKLLPRVGVESQVRAARPAVLRQKIVSAQLFGRRAVVKLSNPRISNARVAVLRGHRVVARSIRVQSQRGTLRVRFNRQLRHGRYTLRVFSGRQRMADRPVRILR